MPLPILFIALAAVYCNPSSENELLVRCESDKPLIAADLLPLAQLLRSPNETVQLRTIAIFQKKWQQAYILSYSIESERKAQTVKVEEFTKSTVDGLVLSLRSPSSSIRYESLRTLSLLKDMGTGGDCGTRIFKYVNYIPQKTEDFPVSVFEDLIRCLHENDNHIVAGALDWLTLAQIKDIKPLLSERLRGVDTDDYVKLVLADYFPFESDEEAFNIFDQIAIGDDHDVKELAALSLSDSISAPRVAFRNRKHLSNLARFALAIRLARSGDHSDIELLSQMIGDTDADVKACVLHALANREGGPLLISSGLAKTFINDPNPKLRIECLYYFSMIDGPIIQELAKKGLFDEDKNVRYAASEYCNAKFDLQMTDLIIEAIKNDPEYNQIRYLRDPHNRPKWSEWARSENENLRLALAKSLSFNYISEIDKTYLLTFLRDRSLKVLQEAVSIAAYSEKYGAQYIMKIAESEDGERLATIIESFSQVIYASEYLSFFEKLTKSSNGLVRRAAISAVKLIHERNKGFQIDCFAERSSQEAVCSPFRVGNLETNHPGSSTPRLRSVTQSGSLDAKS